MKEFRNRTGFFVQPNKADLEWWAHTNYADKYISLYMLKLEDQLVASGFDSVSVNGLDTLIVNDTR